VLVLAVLVLVVLVLVVLVLVVLVLVVLVLVVLVVLSTASSVFCSLPLASGRVRLHHAGRHQWPQVQQCPG
jgi:hypothetical protein